MWDQYNIGLLVVLISGVIGFLALAIETDDLHRLLLLDLVEITTLGVIALLGTDLAEALVLPGSDRRDCRTPCPVPDLHHQRAIKRTTGQGTQY